MCSRSEAKDARTSLEKTIDNFAGAVARMDGDRAAVTLAPRPARGLERAAATVPLTRARRVLATK